MPKNEPSTKIVNYYEKIPKELLDNVPNPNLHLHHIKLPFRAVCCSPSGSGKTNFICNLIYLFSCGKTGTFSTIHIITRNKDEPLYKYLQTKSPQIIIKEGIENIPPLDKFDKTEAHLVIFDDLQLAKDQSAIENYYIRARKLNCSVVYLCQNYFKCPKTIRSNCNYMFILKLNGDRECKMILSDFGLGITKEQLLHIYQYATKEKFSPLLIDLEEEPTKRFRKGFDEVLDPNIF